MGKSVGGGWPGLLDRWAARMIDREPQKLASLDLRKSGGPQVRRATKAPFRYACVKRRRKIAKASRQRNWRLT